MKEAEQVNHLCADQKISIHKELAATFLTVSLLSFQGTGLQSAGPMGPPSVANICTSGFLIRLVTTTASQFRWHENMLEQRTGVGNHKMTYQQIYHICQRGALSPSR